jgi:hypothetical protein
MKQISYEEYNALTRRAEEPRYVPPNPIIVFLLEAVSVGAAFFLGVILTLSGVFV